ncbi:hypothetical protein ACFL59_00670 [Planctomycetota bacterium]
MAQTCDEEFVAEYVRLSDRLALASFLHATGERGQRADKEWRDYQQLLDDAREKRFADPAIRAKLLELRQFRAHPALPGGGRSDAYDAFVRYAASFRERMRESADSVAADPSVAATLSSYQRDFALGAGVAERLGELEQRLDHALGRCRNVTLGEANLLDPDEAFRQLDAPLARHPTSAELRECAAVLCRLDGRQSPPEAVAFHPINERRFFMVSTRRPPRCHVAIPSTIQTLFELRCFAHEIGHTAGCGEAASDRDAFLGDSALPSEDTAYRYEVLLLENLGLFSHLVESVGQCRRRLFLGRYLKFLLDAIKLKVALRFFTGCELRELNRAFCDVVCAQDPDFAPRSDLDFLAFCGIPASFYQASDIEAFLQHYVPLAGEFG